MHPRIFREHGHIKPAGRAGLRARIIQDLKSYSRSQAFELYHCILCRFNFVAHSSAAGIRLSVQELRTTIQG